MPRYDWLTKPERPYTWGFALRVVIKAVVLFAALNVLFAWLDPLPGLGRASLYNAALPGRDRLPYGEDSARSHTLTMFSLPAMFASHRLDQPKARDEFRVLLLGDSGIWGWLLASDQTIAAHITQAGARLADDRRVVVYNLGYPIPSAMQDLMLLDYALRYDPDLVLWPVTLQSLAMITPASEDGLSEQIRPPLVQHNPDRARALIAAYDLPLDTDDPRFVTPDFLDRTLIGQRRAIADWVRLQFYGVSWSATGIDQTISADYTRVSSDLSTDESWQGYTPDAPFTADDLAFDVLRAGIDRAGDVPVWIINEPIFIADGENSDLRYNAWYPRWAYDRWRDLLMTHAAGSGWTLIDLWSLLPPEMFTDSPVHTTSAGAQIIAQRLMERISE
jgi:hypothetical protein